MAQTMNANGNASARGERCASTDDDKDSVAPYYLETPYGYQLDLDFLKYVDDIERGNTIKKLNIQRKPKAARPEAAPRGGSTSGAGAPAEWASTESLSSSNSDESKQSPLFFATRTLSAPPLTPTPTPSPASSLGRPAPGYEAPLPPHATDLSITEHRQLPLIPPSSPSPRAAPLRNPQVEKTLLETRRRLEQERLLMQPPSEPPPPRRRLASFGGLGSSSSLSSFSGSLGASQISPGSHILLPNGHLSNGEYNPYYTPSLGSSIRHSPMSSGMTTPVTNVSPLHLQHIREQMVVALKRLKELEEQVKTIPILQVKISVLQEEKRQLTAQARNQNQGLGGGFRKRSYSVGSADQLDPQGPSQREAELRIVEPEGQEQMSSQRLEEFRFLAAEVQALEKKTQDNAGPDGGATTRASVIITQNQAHNRDALGTTAAADENMNNVTVVPRREPPHLAPTEHRDVGVATERRETQCAAVGVTEAMLGVTTEAEAEIELQQQTIDALKEKIYRLEAALKDTTHQMEMGKLKLQLQAAGGAGKKADKGCMARPECYSTATEARVQTHSQGVGNHLELSHTGTTHTPQTQTVGLSCQPDVCSAAVGPEVPMDRWVVQERVEVREQCVGRHVEECHQGVGVELNVCEVGVNTEESVDNLVLREAKAEPTKESRSVGCGECSVDVTVGPIKELTSRGTDPDVVGRVDLGVMVTPETVSQDTNTEVEAVSTSTNTECAVLADSFTNTMSDCCEKQTSTVPTETRTVAVGEGLVKDLQVTPKTRSVSVGTALESAPVTSVTARTKDCGVGPVSIHQNFLVGLKTRNIACGPSHPAETAKTKSELCQETTTTTTMAAASNQAVPLPPQAQGGGGIDHYIEKVQKLLQEQQMLLAENYTELADAFGQPHSQFGSLNSQLVNTLDSINTAIKLGSTEELRSSVDILRLQPDNAPANRDGGQLQTVVAQSVMAGTELSWMEAAVAAGDQVPQMAEDHQGPPPPLQPSAAEQKSRMDQQMSTALHGQPCSQNTLKSIMKKKDGRQGSNGTKKNLQFVGVPGGYESTSSEDSSSEESSTSGEDNAEEEETVYGGGEEVFGNEEGNMNDGAGEEKRKEEEGASVKPEMRESYELSEKMVSACNLLKTSLNDPKALTSKDMRACLNTVQHEWFRVSSQKCAVPGMVEDYLAAFRTISPEVLRHVVNMADGNGNTALHYSVSHSNFAIVKKLLDADVCNVNQQNQAGYTPIMLAALAAVDAPADMRVVEELFSKGEVNARASQAGQTGLMLAVSHGRMDMVRALLAQGAQVNIQDDEGSTALMCASEHGHAEIVKLLLAQPGCDATLSDSDESNALSIALEAGHKDIAVLLYAHVNFSRTQSPGTPRLGRKTSPSPTRRGMFN